MCLTSQEAELFKNYLRSLSLFRNAELPLGAKIWEPWMDQTIQRLSDLERSQPDPLSRQD